MKYLGGLSIGIRFRNDYDVNEFLMNEKYWGNWFSEFKFGNSYDELPGRIAWLKIIGLPLHMWSEENFARIAGTVGKILSPSEIPISLQDVSCGKICVLTDRKTKINEVVAVESKRYILWVGIAEVDFDWSPFPSGYWLMEDCDVQNEICDRVNSVENDYSNPEGDEDGISEKVNSTRRDPTDGRLLDDEWEEGEIQNDDDIGADKAAVSEMGSMERESSPETWMQVAETPVTEA
ncbi:unnamed protein product [Lactuca virosa]|uniref:DUF4283 domain-containing protein n=1 Tax=Lactuca virosa TaxID=75947 RepID=A0AAU9PTV2_9ASTR|nr:unnamed protein product [Lactuca virosa]